MKNIYFNILKLTCEFVFVIFTVEIKVTGNLQEYIMLNFPILKNRCTLAYDIVCINSKA